MRDEAVASQDHDPTTEGASTGETPDGRGTGPSDASETIVSGSHAAATTGGPQDPAQHDDWDAEFAGLAGAAPEDSKAAAGSEAPDQSKAAAGSEAPAEEAAGKPVAGDSEGAEGLAGGMAATGKDMADAGARRRAAEPEPLAETGTGEGATAAKPGPKRDEVPGGHPSLPQRSTLPMRAASTMPDLNRFKGEDKSDAVGSTPEPEAEHTQPAPHPTEAAGGPWYGPGDAAEAAAPKAPAADPVAEDPAISTEEAARRSAERERAATAKPVLGRVIQVAIAVFFPVMLLAAAIRAVATPLFLWVEYNRPGFPVDSFGFSSEDRLTYGSYAVDYLLNFASPRYLGDLVTPDGDPLYLASEVSHMADVKTVLTIAFVTALGMALLSLAGGVYLARRCPGGIRRALFAGAVATLALIAGLLVAAVLAWEEFFTMVHTIFFSQGNWTFRLDDTLIRLFPAQFWMDAGGAIAGIVLLVCVLVMIFTWPTRKRRERSRLAREEARRRYLESLEGI
ncbi:DUF1461 domain-containing protein [Arthrobacter sp. BL-252-APC-1A]|uniref:DUF1461 domain-containing protein n=1 Tax=Arthrobacter TaxID=1663 RepID=UPI001E4F5C83|nr:DUF1461 domain-containing protein [Arthrobacter sp. BL-252-APC-1A]